ncbi:MAG: tetratricopeptide repeat protein [Phycisphaerae bacterium]|nr:tetratricopeptide repeat protein [Phycisphaerae bacterium]
MEPAISDALDAILSRDAWTINDYQDLMTALSTAPGASNRCRQILADLEAKNPSPRGAKALMIGILRYMLCRFEEAISVLADATDNRDRHFFAGQCYRACRRFDQAVEEFERAKARGWEGPDGDVLIVEALAMGGKPDQAAKTLKGIARQVDGTATGLYLQGLLTELDGRGEEAAELYEQARDLNPAHGEATFRLAYYLDLHGQEEEAVELYRQCLSHPPIHASALLNLAVLHEDMGQYDKAISCLKRLLAVNPNHPRARLFLRDAQASRHMYYDEDQARRIAKRNAVLDIPVTDFELSVRARNCLKKMNIMTLGDLVRTTETELLGYKNFGETSLKEIKDMLAAKGLRLGQDSEGAGGELGELLEEIESDEPGADHGAAALTIEQVEFSVRARRVLEQLNVRTLGDLAAKTEAELLSQKNFGQTSLAEMRQRLSENGLHFREM